ncbi:LysR substrate-binding domain-containing protein [uncultured Bradyrhizobium sp.]|uniref:LysR substrate-binding domain-containing protein n=1 Tax=Bradyrhizobium sp. TaxID=376 RepID=UPI00343AE6BE
MVLRSGAARDLLALPLVEAKDPAWPQWFEAAGCPTPNMTSRPALRLAGRDFYGQAALAGRGVALLTPELYARELSTGQLMQPFSTVIDLEPRAYWFVYPASRKRSRPIRLLQNWLAGRA